MTVCFSVQALAELLTTNKLSELACLTLYLMYEKKNGKQSVWFELIKASRFSTCRGQVIASDMHDASMTAPCLRQEHGSCCRPCMMPHGLQRRQH